MTTTTSAAAATLSSNPAAARPFLEAARKLEAEGRRHDAIAEYRKAKEHDPAPDTVFRMAFLMDLLGHDSEAMHAYEELCCTPNPPVNALVNLAVIYEDRGDYVRAERCLRKVVDTDPTHRRARLFTKDVVASRTMYYDEKAANDTAKHAAVLHTPVTDFELSVRARNCLRKMNIRTLGDLLRITEAELLAYKNFGDTSLVEIKQMLSSRGLRLGQGLEGGQAADFHRDYIDRLREAVPEQLLNQPISGLDLSVRSRKALQVLGIATIGELASRTEAELMGVKNFGATSLDEIKAKLVERGLSLRVIE
jgi:DNA-directed RNA polymerase subunit alpha